MTEPELDLGSMENTRNSCPGEWRRGEQENKTALSARQHEGLALSVPESCPTLCEPENCSLPGSSVHGILQARILACVAMPSSRGSLQPRDRTQVSHIAGEFFTLSHQGSP